MIYPDALLARFLDRPNRFIANCRLSNGETVVCHVKNTGRCKELLTQHAIVSLVPSDQPNRKTKYDLVAVKKGDVWFNIDSMAPNRLFLEWMESGRFLPNITNIRPEWTKGDSRFDFLVEVGETKCLVEVKGVTLEEDGVLYFPDAPTLRGVKHLNGLIQGVKEGYQAFAVFVIQTKKARYFSPHPTRHPEFAKKLREAAKAGVQLLAFSCEVEADRITPGEEVPVVLS